MLFFLVRRILLLLLCDLCSRRVEKFNYSSNTFVFQKGAGVIDNYQNLHVNALKHFEYQLTTKVANIQTLAQNSVG